MKTRALYVPLALVAVACGDIPTPTAVLTPSFAIRDGAHGGGNPHFYWLPPTVAAPDEQYFVNFDSGLFTLDPQVNYRIRVLVAGMEIGFADVDVVSNAADLRNVDRENYVPLRNRRSLLIALRIEEGALGASLTLVKHVVNDNGRTAAAGDFTLTATGPARGGAVINSWGGSRWTASSIPTGS